MTDAIKVAVRIRPLPPLKPDQQLKPDQTDPNSFAWNINNNTLCVKDSSNTQQYTLDHVFMPELSTEAIYKATTRPLLDKVISGFNSTVFAYGQTSSGKTFTMRGTPNEPGIVPLSVHDIFQLIENCQDREFLLRVSYMEVGLLWQEIHCC